MEDKLLKEINRFREISKLPLLTEQLAWLDNLIKSGVKRISTLDDIISKIGYKGVDLTENEIDVIINEFKSAGLSREMIEQVKSLLKSDSNLRRALTTTSDDFVSALKTASQKTKKPTGGFALIRTLDPAQIQSVIKSTVTKLLDDPKSNLSTKYLIGLDDSVSNALQKIYDNGQVLNSVDEMYDIFDGFINRILTESKIDSTVADQILQSFKIKYRTNSKTKELLDKFKLEGRSLDRTSRVGKVNKYDNADLLSDDWLSSSKWKGTDGNGKPLMHEKPIDSDIFKGLNINTEFISAYRMLKGKINTKNPKIKEYVDAINKGVTMNTDNIFEDLKGVLGTKQIEQIKLRLENPSPIKKIGTVSDIFWTYVEPIVANLRELFKTSGRAESVFKTITKKPPKSTLDDFMNTLESVQINFDGKLTEGQIKSLKDKFSRLKSEGDIPDTYAKLFDDLDNFLNSKLDDTGKKEWTSIKSQLMSENPSDWKWVTWKEMIGDTDIIKNVEKETYEVFNPVTLKKERVPEIASKSFNILKKYRGNIFSWLLTGSFQSPKQLKQFLLKNGYAKRDLYGKLNLSASGKNYVNQWFITTFVLPLGYALGEYIYEGLENRGLTRSDYDDGFIETYMDYVLGDFLPKKMNEEFKEASPEWYQFLSPILDFSINSPLVKAFKASIEGKVLDFKTQEEKDLREFDEKIKKIQDDLQENPPSSAKQTEMDFWKLVINTTMVNRRLLTKEMSKLVTDNMSIKRGIDPNVVNGLRGDIKTIHSDDKFIDKATKISENMKTVDAKVKGSAVEHIVVTTANGIFKLIYFEDITKAVMYIKPDYETLMKTPNVEQTTHPLNELKF